MRFSSVNCRTPLLSFVTLLCFLPSTLHAELPGSSSILIGNFLLGAPCGIAWVVNDSAAFVLDTGGPYVAGTAAADDSYHAQRFGHDGANVVLEWGTGWQQCRWPAFLRQTGPSGVESVEWLARLDINFPNGIRRRRRCH